jgi:hypothetical protein
VRTATERRGQSQLRWAQSSAARDVLYRSLSPQNAFTPLQDLLFRPSTCFPHAQTTPDVYAKPLELVAIAGTPVRAARGRYSSNLASRFSSQLRGRPFLRSLCAALPCAPSPHSTLSRSLAVSRPPPSSFLLLRSLHGSSRCFSFRRPNDGEPRTCRERSISTTTALPFSFTRTPSPNPPATRQQQWVSPPSSSRPHLPSRPSPFLSPHFAFFRLSADLTPLPLSRTSTAYGASSSSRNASRGMSSSGAGMSALVSGMESMSMGAAGGASRSAGGMGAAYGGGASFPTSLFPFLFQD